MATGQALGEDTTTMPTQTALMTGAELACTRAFLGFSPSQLADYLRIDLRRLQRMEKGEASVPAGIIDEIDDMYEVATNLVNNLVLQYKAKVKKAEGEDVILITQRDGDTTGRYPACWHRGVCARVAAQVPGVIIDYAPEDGMEVGEDSEGEDTP